MKTKPLSILVLLPLLRIVLTGIPSLASPWTETPKTVLCLRFDYTPTNGTPFTQVELLNRMLAASNAIVEMSYSNTWVVPTVSTQVFTLPHDSNYYCTAGEGLTIDANMAATSAGYNLTNYDILLYSYFTPCAGPSITAQGPQPRMYMLGAPALSTFVHELGHAYGLNHAGVWWDLTGTGFFGHNYGVGNGGGPIEYTANDYADPFDTMAVDWYTRIDGTPVFPAGHYSMHEKATMNWIKPQEVFTVTASGTYRIFRFDHKDARANPGTHLALKIPLANRDREEVWVGFRRNFTNVTALATGAYIVWAQDPSRHFMLDAEPFVTSSLHPASGNAPYFWEEGALPPHRSYTDPSGTARITTLDWGGTEPYEYIDVQVEILPPTFQLFTDFTRAVPGLKGSYVNQSLRGRAAQEDWANTAGISVSGTRVDRALYFPTDSWGGTRSSLGLTGGSETNWDNFSVQWDGVIVVNHPLVLATKSDDSSRMWLDLNGDNAFGSASPEFINNHWGSGQGATQGDASQVILPGAYRIRIQYEEGINGNTFALVSSDAQFDLVPSIGSATLGLTGSYVNRSLRNSATQDDWRASQTISGTRLDAYPGFWNYCPLIGWGLSASVGVTGTAVNCPGGSSIYWDNFSVQWDGYLRVYRPTRFVMKNSDGSRMWIDLNHDGFFGTTAPELITNHWGQAQSDTIGAVSANVQPGTYAVRIQYEAGGGGSSFTLFGAKTEVPSPAAAVDAGLRVYDGTAIVRVACEAPGTDGWVASPVQIDKNGRKYGVFTTETNSSSASRVRVMTSSGVKAWMQLPR